MSIINEMAQVQPEGLALYQAGKKAVASQQYSEAIKLFGDALEKRPLPNAFKAQILDLRGECHWFGGNHEQAAIDYAEALAAAELPEQRARLKTRLGDLADSGGNYEMAISLYQEALQEGTLSSDLVAIGRAHRGLGIVHRRQGDSERALVYLNQALVAFRQVNDAREQARVLTSIGRTRLTRGEYNGALRALNQAFKILQTLEDGVRTIFCLNSIGECHRLLYAIDSAIRFHKDGLELAERHQATLIIPELKGNLGYDLILLNQVQEGLAYLIEAEQAASDLGQQEQLAAIRYYMVLGYLKAELYGEANRALDKLDYLADSMSGQRYQALASFARGEMLYALGQREEAVAELQNAMLLAQQSFDRGLAWKLHAAMSQVVDNEGIAMVHAQIAAEYIRETVEPLQNKWLREAFLYAPPVIAVLRMAGMDIEELL